MRVHVRGRVLMTNVFICGCHAVSHNLLAVCSPGQSTSDQRGVGLSDLEQLSTASPR